MRFKILVVEARAKGANDCLVKPFLLSDLKAKLNKIYNKRLSSHGSD